MPDPSAISQFTWQEIGKLLHNLWYFFALIFVTALFLVTSLAIIPSLVASGHLPRTASLFRFSMVLTGLALLGLAITLMIYSAELARVIMESFYDRYWI
ncbi:MAG: hypothetical protein FJ320_02860 [SAR202 cluster bacterium]|nr:hypothetical protein [SAR202 cluster bacterium]